MEPKSIKDDYKKRVLEAIARFDTTKAEIKARNLKKLINRAKVRKQKRKLDT
jgi:hypothetical protein